jgi:hypothetical protein
MDLTKLWTQHPLRLNMLVDVASAPNRLQLSMISGHPFQKDTFVLFWLLLAEFQAMLIGW